jgi:hypothetical protein
MTPKEKAKELHKKFIQGIWKTGNPNHVANHGKECAIIAVDEIIQFHAECKSLPDRSPLDFMGTGTSSLAASEERDYEKNWADLKVYWEDVKKEIESL